jgi:hypothetical protein
MRWAWAHGSVDITEVPDFNKVRDGVVLYRLGQGNEADEQMYELYDPCTLMFFYR